MDKVSSRHTEKDQEMPVDLRVGTLAIALLDLALQVLLWGVLSWSPTYLSDVYHSKLVSMGAFAGVYFATGAIGTYLGSRLSDTVFGGNRRPAVVIGLLGATCSRSCSRSYRPP
jgi:sugar phosphate permease